MVTPITSFNRRECELIPGIKVDAYTDLYLDPENPTGIILESTWNTSKVDLKDIVKAGETVTHIYLAPENDPVGICYEREDGQTDYISGDELSRIVSMQYLKDVDQETPVGDGDVYQYNDETQLFEPFDLKAFVTNTNLAIGRLQAAITNLQNQITALDGRVSDIEAIIPFYPDDKATKLARGDINLISDPSNTNNKAHGLFTHDKSTDLYADEYFS